MGALATRAPGPSGTRYSSGSRAATCDVDWANRRVLAFYRPFWVEGSDSGWSSAKLSTGTLGAAGITWSSVEHPYAAAVNTWKIAVDQSYSQPGQTRFGLVYRSTPNNKAEARRDHLRSLPLPHPRLRHLPSPRTCSPPHALPAPLQFNHGHYTHEGMSGPTLDFGSPALVRGADPNRYTS